ncbi:MAG: hypothetical protein CM15mP74_37150 [Halieaceae bacterium]|nr:MAG: hypothetical protein CM15mP74_37150 [Halieaceae bacterium]
MVFYNCGPAPMIHASEAVQKEFVSSDRIFSAIDYLTKCGVGICGACTSPDGRRICVDGPFITDGLTENRAASGYKSPSPPAFKLLQPSTLLNALPAPKHPAH